ncbi:MAG: hypothetical protein BV457_07225 [Thermoplasmata archaeon M9B1D]|nr:MAG: hypothetical protein BV457_07225 [Thermoplasmata archaeon M9B1D]
MLTEIFELETPCKNCAKLHCTCNEEIANFKITKANAKYFYSDIALEGSAFILDFIEQADFQDVRAEDWKMKAYATNEMDYLSLLQKR